MGERGSPTIGLVTLAAALAAAGWWVSGSLLRFRTADRTVTVTGLAEREVPADLVVWPIAFTEAGNDLGVIYEQSQAHARLIAEFLEFAKDSESRVGRIRSANQGQISIDDRDEGTADVKKVRVVTTIEYELRDD